MGARGLAAAFATVALAALAWSGGAAPLSAQEAGSERGREVYDRWCASCHGFEGAGDGPAAEWMLPRPRDFTRGIFQIRTTANGEIPTDEDLRRVIDEGMPGTTMPGWSDQLSSGDREALVEYVKTFYPPFETLPEAEPLDFPGAPRASDDRIAEGRLFYDSIECWQCHGAAGRGDGGSAPELEDDWDNPVRAADLTQGWRFNGGGSVEEIYRRLRTGMDGTPMPSFSDLLDAGFMTDDELWSLAHYVRSLSPEGAPRVREVIRAGRVEPGQLPTALDDERWDEAESFYVPLVGQVVVLPRWFEPTVDDVRVEALHDEEELVLRITWHDPSESPDPTWMQWQERVIAAMEPKEGDSVEPEPRPDRLAVQFPVSTPEGSARPYFLMGDGSEPVHLWRWRSDEEAVSPALAAGMEDIQDLGGTLDAEASWEDGQWRLLVRRALEPEDPDDAPTFEPGVAMPVAFFAWDGDNGEEGTRGAISSWYFVHLEEETPMTTYVAPVIAFLLTGLLGMGIAGRAQKRARESGEEGAGALGAGIGGGPHPATGPGPAARAE